MSRVVLDPSVFAYLQNIKGPAELCDPDGKAFALFTPVSQPAPRPEPPEWGRPQISDEEIRRRLKEGGGRTLDEILADLEKRG